MHKVYIYCLIGMISFTLTSCSDKGSRYIGKWKSLDSQETIEIRKNGQSFILDVEKQGRFTGSMQPDETIEFSVGPMPMRISIDNMTGNLLIGGQGEYKKVVELSYAAQAKLNAAMRNAQNICSVTSACVAMGYDSRSWKSVKDAVDQIREGITIKNIDFKVEISDAEAEDAMTRIRQENDGSLQYIKN